MAYQVYVTVTGAKQGAFKGGCTQKDLEGKIKAIAVSYGATIPRDTGTGLATGKRVQKPVTISLAWDVCSPQFFSAAYTNETLTSVLIEYYVTGEDCVSTIDHTVTLKNASISEITESYAAMTNGTADGRDMQTVALTFQSIEVTSSVSKLTAVDEWRPYA
jgi:type VI secretion system secreted protein Hcp